MDVATSSLLRCTEWAPSRAGPNHRQRIEMRLDLNKNSGTKREYNLSQMSWLAVRPAPLDIKKHLYIYVSILDSLEFALTHSESGNVS